MESEEGRENSNEIPVDIQVELYTKSVLNIIQRNWSINQMYLISKQHKILKEESQILDILKFFIFNAFFIPPEGIPNKVVLIIHFIQYLQKSKLDYQISIPSPPVSNELRKVITQKFFSLLGDLNNSSLSFAENGISKKFYHRELISLLDKERKDWKGKMNDGNFFSFFALDFIFKLTNNKIKESNELSEEAKNVRIEAYNLCKQIQSEV